MKGVPGLLLLFVAMLGAQQSGPPKVATAPGFSGSANQRNAATPADLQRIFKEAVEAQQSGDMAAAIARYEEFLELKPDFVHAWSNLGAALASQGRLDEAARKYSKALNLEPGNTAIRLNLALAYYKQMELQSAATELVRVRKEQPGNTQALYLLADTYLKLGENKKVIELLKPFDIAHPDDKTVAYLFGTALLNDKQVDRGQQVIDRFMKQGSSAEAHMLIGETQLAAGDYGVALVTIRKAVELNPDLPGVYALLGRALMENDLQDEAKQAFQKELSRDPLSFDANLRLGALLRIEKKLDEAEPYVQRALRIRPRSVSARYQLGGIKLASGDAAGASEILETVVRDAPEFVEAHVNLASAYYKLGRREDGQRHRKIVMDLQAENRKRERERPEH